MQPRRVGMPQNMTSPAAPQIPTVRKHPTQFCYRYFKRSIVDHPNLDHLQPININMSSNGASPRSVTNRNLEARLRGMILSNDKTGAPHEPAPGQRPSSYLQRQPVPFFGMPGNTNRPGAGFNQLPHPTAQTSGLSPIFPMNSNLLPVTQGLPPPGFFPQGGDFTNVPALPALYQTYPGPPPPPTLQTTGLPPQAGLQYSPSQRSVPQSQSPNISPNTPPHQDYMPPHIRHIYGHQPTSPQSVSPSARRHSQPPPVQTPRTPSQRRGHSYQFSNLQNTPRVPPPTALDHFPPLGTAQQAKTNSPLSNPYHQQPTVQKPQQRTQYQPLPINTRNFDHPARGGGPLRGNFRTPNHAGRPSQQYIEQISAEQNHYLNDFSKRIIAEAAPPAAETTVKHTLLKRLEAICKEVSPDAQLIPFGSLVSECTLFSSNITLPPVFLKRIFHRPRTNKHEKQRCNLICYRCSFSFD